MKHELPDELSVSWKGRQVPYEIKRLTRHIRRKLAMMMMDKEGDDWGAELFIESIDGKPPEEAPNMLQNKVWADAEDFLTHQFQSIGADDSKYAPMRDSGNSRPSG